MDNISVRPFTMDDLERIQDIAFEAWQPIFKGYREQIGDDLFEQSRPDPNCKRKELQTRAENSPERIVVAVDKNGNKILKWCYYDELYEYILELSK